MQYLPTYLQDMRDPESYAPFRYGKPINFTGNRKDVWSLHVTRNWRLTFRIKNVEIEDVNYEDYHQIRAGDHADA